MAKAVFEKREFKNQQTGETIKYDFYGVQGVVDGELMELKLANLNNAEKIAFKVVAAGETPDPVEQLLPETRKATGEEKAQFDANIKRKTILDDDEDEGGLFD